MKSTVNEKPSEDTGTAVSANSIYDIGEHDSDWEDLKPFHGTVTLEN